MTEDEPTRGLRQAERYGGPASDGRLEADPGAPRTPPLRAAYIGGAAMIAATVVSGWLGAPALLAFLIGLGVFAAIVVAMRPGGPAAAGGSAGPLTVDRAAASAAGLDPDRAQERLDTAETALRAMIRTARGFDDRPLEERVRAAAEESRATLTLLAEDPGDIDRARKFLVVTVPSAAAAVEKYAALGVRDPALSERFGALMDDVAEAARRQRAALRRDEALDLEVEMDVLAERLRNS